MDWYIYEVQQITIRYVSNAGGRDGIFFLVFKIKNGKYNIYRNMRGCMTLFVMYIQYIIFLFSKRI